MQTFIDLNSLDPVSKNRLERLTLNSSLISYLVHYHHNFLSLELVDQVITEFQTLLIRHFSKYGLREIPDTLAPMLERHNILKHYWDINPDDSFCSKLLSALEYAFNTYQYVCNAEETFKQLREKQDQDDLKVKKFRNLVKIR